MPPPEPAAARAAAPAYEVPLWRLYVLRGACLVFAIALGFSNLPALIWPDPMGRGMITGILGGLWVMALIGIRYPLLVVPVFLFEPSGKRSGCCASGCRNGWPGRARRD